MVAPRRGLQTLVWNRVNTKLPVGHKIFQWPVEHQRALLAYETTATGLETQRAALQAYLADMNLPVGTIRFVMEQRQIIVRRMEYERLRAHREEIRRYELARPRTRIRPRALEAELVGRRRGKKRYRSGETYWIERNFNFDKWARGF